MFIFIIFITIIIIIFFFITHKFHAPAAISRWLSWDLMVGTSSCRSVEKRWAWEKARVTIVSPK
jgi:hypothetical protein